MLDLQSMPRDARECYEEEVAHHRERFSRKGGWLVGALGCTVWGLLLYYFVIP